MEPGRQLSLFAAQSPRKYKPMAPAGEPSQLGNRARTLPMVKTAREISQQHHVLNDDRDPILPSGRFNWDADYPMESNKQVLNRKATEADHSGLSIALQEHGVTTPVPLSTVPVRSSSQGDGRQRRPQILNGHHRVGSMLANAPHELMPVEHYPTAYVQFPPDRGPKGQVISNGYDNWDDESSLRHHFGY